MGCTPDCRNVVLPQVREKTVLLCCCCAEQLPIVPSWLKKAFLVVMLAVPVVLAARWIVTKGHLEYINERMQFLCSEKETLEWKIQSLMEECCPSQKKLSCSTARRKAALDQLKCWARKSNCTFEKVIGLRKEKFELEQMLTRVLRERDVARKDLEIVQNVIRRNCNDLSVDQVGCGRSR